jgi:hypothetical protein
MSREQEEAEQEEASKAGAQIYHSGQREIIMCGGWGCVDGWYS